jgi:glutathione S-transferase
MMEVLQRQLSRGFPYVCGETFTVADIVIGLSVNRWFQTPIERRDLPEVRAYFDRLVRRPAAALHLGGNTD